MGLVALGPMGTGLGCSGDTGGTGETGGWGATGPGETGGGDIGVSCGAVVTAEILGVVLAVTFPVVGNPFFFPFFWAPVFFPGLVFFAILAYLNLFLKLSDGFVSHRAELLVSKLSRWQWKAELLELLAEERYISAGRTEKK